VKPGEYVGKDGKLYTVCNSYADISAAKAALDALIEAEAEEWVDVVSLDHRCADYALRIRRDGSNPQYLGGATRAWVQTREDEDWALAYRKGREVALEQVQQLDAVGWLAYAIDYIENRKLYHISEEETIALLKQHWEAAKKLKL